MRQLDSSLQPSHKDESDNSTSHNQSLMSSSPPTNEDLGVALRLAPHESSSTSSSIHSTNLESNSCSTQDTSIKDLKAAVENIQKLFSIHLLEQQQDSDDTWSICDYFTITFELNEYLGKMQIIKTYELCWDMMTVLLRSAIRKKADLNVVVTTHNAIIQWHHNSKGKLLVEIIIQVWKMIEIC